LKSLRQIIEGEIVRGPERWFANRATPAAAPSKYSYHVIVSKVDKDYKDVERPKVYHIGDLDAAELTHDSLHTAFKTFLDNVSKQHDDFGHSMFHGIDAVKRDEPFGTHNHTDSNGISTNYMHYLRKEQ
jgi:hypothetical protein